MVLAAQDRFSSTFGKRRGSGPALTTDLACDPGRALWSVDRHRDAAKRVVEDLLESPVQAQLAALLDRSSSDQLRMPRHWWRSYPHAAELFSVVLNSITDPYVAEARQLTVELADSLSLPRTARKLTGTALRDMRSDARQKLISTIYRTDRDITVSELDAVARRGWKKPWVELAASRCVRYNSAAAAALDVSYVHATQADWKVALTAWAGHQDPLTRDAALRRALSI